MIIYKKKGNYEKSPDYIDKKKHWLDDVKHT